MTEKQSALHFWFTCKNHRETLITSHSYNVGINNLSKKKMKKAQVSRENIANSFKLQLLLKALAPAP